MSKAYQLLQREHVASIRDVQKNPSRSLRGMTRVMRGSTTFGFAPRARDSRRATSSRLRILPSRMGFEFVFTKKAKQDLGSLDRAVAKRIVRKLLWWQKQTDPFAYAKRLQEPSRGD